MRLSGIRHASLQFNAYFTESTKHKYQNLVSVRSKIKQSADGILKWIRPSPALAFIHILLRAICHACMQFNRVSPITRLIICRSIVFSSSTLILVHRSTIQPSWTWTMTRRIQRRATYAYNSASIQTDQRSAHRIVAHPVAAKCGRGLLKCTRTDRNQLVPASFSLFVARFPGVRPRNFNFIANLARSFATGKFVSYTHGHKHAFGHD